MDTKPEITQEGDGDALKAKSSISEVAQPPVIQVAQEEEKSNIKRSKC
jgi:hypothetical protein